MQVLAPPTVRKLFETQFVPVVVSLSEHICIVFKVWVLPQEFAKSSVQVLYVSISLVLHFLRLVAIRDISEYLEVLELVSQLCQSIPNLLKVPLIQAHKDRPFTIFIVNDVSLGR